MPELETAKLILPSGLLDYFTVLKEEDSKTQIKIYLEEKNKLIDFPFMRTLPDYSIVRFKNRNILCIGGAVSMDRSERLHAMSCEEMNNFINKATMFV